MLKSAVRNGKTMIVGVIGVALTCGGVPMVSMDEDAADASAAQI